MQAVTLGLNQQLAHQFNGADPSATAAGLGGNPGSMDQAQLQQLVQLLGAKMLPKQTAVVECPKSMVGRVIGKGGETIKALQQYTGAMIQIDQSTDPTRVTIAGSPQSLQLAVSMVNDIVRGTFKGFAMLRQIAIGTQGSMAQFGQPQPVYVQGYGFVPPSQVYSPEDTLSASLLRTSPTGPLSPPVPNLRPGAPGGNLTPDALAALLSGGAPAPGTGMPPPYGAGPSQPPQQAGASNDALISQLLSQLTSGQGPPQMPPQMQQAPSPPSMAQQSPPPGLDLANLDPATFQALLAQAGLMAGGQQGPAAPGMPGGMPPASGAQGLPPSAALMMAAQAGRPHAVPAPGSQVSPAGSPYSSGTHAGMLSLAMGGQHPAPGMVPSRPLSAAGSMGGSVGSPPSAGIMSPPVGAVPPPGSTLSGLLQGTNAASSFLGTSPSSSPASVAGSGRTSPAKPGSLPPASAPASTSLKSTSGENSPMGRFGAIGSAMAPPSVGAGSAGPGSAADATELLAAKMGALSTGDAAAASPQRAPEPQLPPGWTKVSDPQGLVYYVNQLTGESTLTPPAPALGPANGAQPTM